MWLSLDIKYLSEKDIDILLPRINLIKDKIYSDLEIIITIIPFTEQTEDKRIRVHQSIEDMDKALTLFKLFNNLNYEKLQGENKISFKCSLNTINEDYGRG